jgi:hypothetical protein
MLRSSTASSLSVYTPPAGAGPLRYAVWVHRTERRITCPRGHSFMPDVTLLSGKGAVPCRHTDRSGRCGTQMLVVFVDKHDERLVAEVSDADLEYMERAGLEGAAEVVFLLRTPVRRAA